MMRSFVLLALVAFGVGCASAYQYGDSRSYADFVKPDPRRDNVTNEIVTLANRHGTAKVSLVGANVFSYVPAGGTDVLFTARDVDFMSRPFAHGGIPVVWPWFNRNGLPGTCQHSFVRQMKWSVVVNETNADVSRLTLELVSNEETKRLWPYDFKLLLTITLADQLSLVLVSENTGSVPFEVTEGFHAYFRLADVNQAVLRGLDGATSVSGKPDIADEVVHGDIALKAGSEGVYKTPRNEYVLFDPAGNRALAIASDGNRRLITWSIPEGKKPATFGDDDWRHFFCVEPATIWHTDALTVLPGRKSALRMTVKAAPLK